MKLKLVILLFLVHHFSICLSAQSFKGYPDEFATKANKMGIEFFFPIESKIKVKKSIKDDFLNYDLVVKSKRKFEIRYFLYPVDTHQFTSFHPHVEITRTIASIATNNELENIRMTSLPHEESIEKFGADWAIYADFVPKESFSRFGIGRIVSLYKEGRGYFNCIILYKKDNLDAFMGLPIRFI